MLRTARLRRWVMIALVLWVVGLALWAPSSQAATRCEAGVAPFCTADDELNIPVLKHGDQLTVKDNDPRLPTQAENDAQQGTEGSPSGTNRFVTDLDRRLGKIAVRVVATDHVNISSPGATIDGVPLSTGPPPDRVLLTAQSPGSQNGIYVWNGAAVAMTRATDAGLHRAATPVGGGTDDRLDGSVPPLE
jgi:hypothetical protein